MNRYEGTGHAPGGYTSLGSLKSSMQNFYQQEITDVGQSSGGAIKSQTQLSLRNIP